MLDSRYFAFVSVSALLVLSPGATLAVVTETALGDGRAAALRTVLGGVPALRYKMSQWRNPLVPQSKRPLRHSRRYKRS